jgi:hypothetical protein
VAPETVAAAPQTPVGIQQQQTMQKMAGVVQTRRVATATGAAPRDGLYMIGSDHEKDNAGMAGENKETRG